MVMKITSSDFSQAPHAVSSGAYCASNWQSEAGGADLTEFEVAARREVHRRAHALRKAQEQGFDGDDERALQQFKLAKTKLKRNASLAALLATKHKEEGQVAAPGESELHCNLMRAVLISPINFSKARAQP